MRICMIMSGYREANAANTGAELQAETQLRQLMALGHSIIVIAKKHTFASKRHEFIEGVEVFRVGPPGTRSLSVIALLIALRNRIDIVHIHGQDTLGEAAIVACKMLQIPSVIKITMAGRIFVRALPDKILPSSWRPFRRIANRITRQASAYIAISDKIAGELPTVGFYPERIRRIANGVDQQRFSPVGQTEKEALRQAYSIPLTKTVVLYSSRLINRKGFDLLLKAWPHILGKNPDAHLVVVGGGKSTAITSLQHLQHEYPNSITYIGQVANTAPFLQMTDVFLFPSRSEGLPNALLEAMSCGCACAASDIEGNNELIVPHQNGILFPADDVQKLVDSVQVLLDDKALRVTLGSNAARLVTEQYEVTSIGQKISNLYEQLVK